MIIGVTGYGYSGASAVIDLLKEYENIQCLHSAFEFQLLQQPDGILDLKDSLVKAQRRLNVNTDINRFIRNIRNPSTYKLRKLSQGKYKELAWDYINQLTRVSWKGYSTYDPVDEKWFFDRLCCFKFNRIVNRLVKVLNSNYSWPPSRRRYFTFIDEKGFDEITKDFLMNVLVSLGFDLKGTIILEQLYNTSDPLAGTEFFDDTISIVVDRDPRDIYTLMNFIYKGKKGIPTSFMPNTGDVDDFIYYYKSLHKEKVNNNNVVYINFEDLIYDYEKVCNSFQEILGVKHIKKKDYFNPAYSINNTMVYSRFPEHNEIYKKIEEELSEYIYPFEKMEISPDYSRGEVTPFDYKPGDIKK